MRKYYEAYDDRYRQVHGAQLQWFSNAPTPIVSGVMERFGISSESCCLEIGCGEGRDAAHLLENGVNLLATDISPEAVAYCQSVFPMYAENFRVLDCIDDTMEKKFDFIYAVAVVHMLVENADRDGFYRFISEHLKAGGYALICSMGDGCMERSSDITEAFTPQERTHFPSGKTMKLAGTSCRMVSFETFRREIKANGLTLVEEGMTASEPDFPFLMYAIVKNEG